MLPKLNLFIESDIDKFLFAGMDLFEEMNNDGERFRAFNDDLNAEGSYFISFSNEQVIDDLLESQGILSFLDDNEDLEIVDEPIGEVAITYLRGFDHPILIEFLKLLLSEFPSIIE